MRNIKTFEEDIYHAFEYTFSVILKENEVTREFREAREGTERRYRIVTEIVTDDKRLTERFSEIIMLQKKKKVAIAIDFETIPFYWEHIPEFDERLKRLPLFPHSGDIAFASIAYISEKNVVSSFSFPVRARSYLKKIKDLVAKKVTELEKNIHEFVGKICDILEDEKVKSKLLGLYFLYEEFGFSKEMIEKIIDEYRTDKKMGVSKILQQIIRKYKEFLLLVTRFEKEMEKFRVSEKLAVEILENLLKMENCVFIAQNPQFELSFILKKFNIERPLRGTDILDYLLGYSEHSLEELEKRYLVPLVEKGLIDGYVEKKKSQTASRSSIERFALYNAEDAAKALIVYLEECRKAKGFKDLVVSNSYKNVSITDAIAAGNEFICSVVVPFAVNAHLNGIKVDIEKCKLMAEKIHEMIEELFKGVNLIINTDSIRDDRFREELYKLYEHKPIVTPKDGKPSISESALKTIYQTTSNEDLRRLVLYVHSIYKYEGLLSRYVEKYLFFVNHETGRIHPWYNVTKTMSGRLSCRDPNIQQVPREPFASCPECFVVPLSEEKTCPLCGKFLEVLVDFREVFVAEEGNCLVMADYSQIEMAILAELSGDPVLIDAINRGLDMHSYNASNVYRIPYEEIVSKKDTDERIKALRQNAKRVTFAVIYGATDEGIAMRERISKDEARKIINTFYEKHPETKRWIEERHVEALNHHVVLVPTGRPRWFTHTDDEKIKESIKRRAQNTPIQGFASDINLVTCETLRRKYGVKIIGAIHDSIIAEVKEKEKETIEKIFEQAVSEVMKLKESLTYIFGLKKVVELIENLKVKLRLETRTGKTWKEVK